MSRGGDGFARTPESTILFLKLTLKKDFPVADCCSITHRLKLSTNEVISEDFY